MYRQYKDLVGYVGVEILKWVEQTIDYFILIYPVIALTGHITRNVDLKYTK